MMNKQEIMLFWFSDKFCEDPYFDELPRYVERNRSGFYCQNKRRCEPRHYVCDDDNDCGDDSDENQQIIDCGKCSTIFSLSNDFMNYCMTHHFCRFLENISQGRGEEFGVLCHK